MSCDKTAWDAAATQYNEDMVGLNTACVNEQMAADAVAAAEQALLDAQAAHDAAQAAHVAAQQRAAQSQLATVAEAEKLGVECACPQIPPPEPAGTVLGG